MDNAMDELKRGGLDRVDDYSQNGGEAMSFSGGKDKMRTFIVGTKVAVKLRDNILEWGAFKETYNGSDSELGASGIKALCNVARIILNNKNDLELDATLEVLRATYKLSNEKLCQVLTRRFDFGEPTKTALKSIFMNWRRHLEYSVINYSDARNRHIDEHPESGTKNNLGALYKNWMAIDQYYNIESSSHLLLYSKFPARPYDIPWLRGEFTEDDVWDIHPAEFHWTISDIPETNLLIRALNASDFTYLGFCPKAPKTRLLKLFSFPIEELYNATKALGGKVGTSSGLSIVTIRPDTQPTFAPPIIKREVEPSGNAVDMVEWYIDQFIKIYMTMKPHFEAVERYYVGMARKLSDIGFKLENMDGLCKN